MTAASSSPALAGRAWWISAEAVTAFGVAGLTFAGHLIYGANRADLALGLSAAWFAALAVVATRPWARRSLDRVRLTPPGVAFALVIGAAALSLTPWAVGGPNPIWAWAGRGPGGASIYPYATLVEIVKLLALAAAFLCGCAIGGDEARARALIRALLLVGGAYAVWAFLDHVFNPALLFGQPRAFDVSRLSASFLSGNTAATLFGALTLLGLSELIRRLQNDWPSRGLRARHVERLAARLAPSVLLVCLSASCLILTLSRAGIAATCGCAIVLIAAAGIARSRRGAVSAPLIGAIAVLGGLLVASLALNADMLQDRLAGARADALVRGAIVAAHWRAFLAAPWSGYGLGSFARINAMIASASNVDVLRGMGATHNLYVQWLEEAGVVGAAPMFATVAVIAVEIARGAARRRRSRVWLMGVLAVLGLFALHGVTDYALQTPSMAVFLSLLLGVAYGVAATR